MMIDDDVKQRFMREFTEICEKLPGIQRIEFYGSFVTDRWRHGDSDIDIAVHGENITGDGGSKRLIQKATGIKSGFGHRVGKSITV